MARHYKDWLTAFVDYASHGEAPPQMYFWTGVSTLAGVLRRKVWIDQKYFIWYPNFYVILVAPPGVVSKSTTANIGMNLLKEVPGIRFGPDVVTSQALVQAFAEVAEEFDYDGAYYWQSALTLVASEFGNLLSTADEGMINMLIELWDNNAKLEKRTKMSGNDLVKAPWINLLACTTPSWIAKNFTEQMIGGGLVSRMIFVYAEKKEHLIAYPSLSVPADHDKTKQKLIDDLCHISLSITGPYDLSPAAIDWGTKWYADLWGSKPKHLDDERFGGYLARKQTHMHKLAMVLAASRSDERVIRDEDLETAHIMLTALEPKMPDVFKTIGASETSIHTQRFLDYVRRRGSCPFVDAYKFVHMHFPMIHDFEAMVAGCVKAGYISYVPGFIKWAGKDS